MVVKTIILALINCEINLIRATHTHTLTSPHCRVTQKYFLALLPFVHQHRSTIILKAPDNNVDRTLSSLRALYVQIRENTPMTKKKKC